ncbi:MAG TPA: hypothetical protein VF950_06465 [Planctomycetota bacterium]
MNEKKPLIIASAALGVIILAGGGMLYYFHFVVLPKVQKALDAAQKAVAEAKDKQGKIKGFKEEIERLKKVEEQKKTRIPNLDSKEYDGLANLLDDIRKRAGVNLSGGTYAQPKAAAGAAAARAAPKGAAAAAAPTTGVHKVQYTMDIRGGFHQLLRYLNLLEKERRFLNVDTFTITKGADTGKGDKAGQAVRNLKVVVSSYTYRTPPAPPTPATATAEADKGGQSTPVPD